jgi:hypothetical protein
MHPIATYTERWPFNEQHVELYATQVRTRYARRWGMRAERVYALSDLQKEPDHYSAKDYAWAKVYALADCILLILSTIALAAWNGNTPVSEWSAGPFVLFWVFLGLAVSGLALALILAPRIEYTFFVRRSASDGFWIGKRGPNRADYESFVAAVRDHINRSAMAA